MHNQNFDSSPLLQKLQEKHAELTSYRESLSWRFFQGEAPDAFKSNFDDSAWEQVKLPLTVDARKGGAWLRTRILVPKEIMGIDVSGSTVKLPSGIIMNKIEIFVNSEKVLGADYWTELRGPRIVLDEETESQKEYVVAVHVFPRFEPVGIPSFSITYSNVEKVAFELESFIQELRFATVLDKKITDNVSKEFNVKVLEKHPSVLIDEIEIARAKLSVLSQKAKEFRVFLVGHAHIDINWLWPWTDTVDTIKDTFGTMVKLLDKYPNFHFSQSQAFTYKVVEEKFPDLFEAIKRHVKRGNWDVTASTWVEADLNMGGNEAMVRQFLEANRYIKKKFGFESKVCWEPDTFGHISTMPQLLRKSGCKYYYLTRCAKEPVFWWESPDGSKVLVFASLYNNTVTPRNIMELVLYLIKHYGIKTSMFVYGVGNHGGGATVDDLEAAFELQKRQVFPELIFSSTHRFYEEFEKDPDVQRAPVVRDELQFTLDGCYTTHGDIKRYNRLCESLLVDAEKFAVFSGNYPRDALRKAWSNALFNQFHDILDGSGTQEAYEYPFELAEEALKITDETLKTSFKSFTEKIKFSKSGVPIVVFNPLSWNRAEVVQAKVPKNLIPRNPIVVSTEDDEKTPVQVDGDEVLFLAKVPSLGYKTYFLVEGGGAEEDSTSLAESDNVLENEYFRAEIEKESGTVKSLYDKTAGRFVVQKNRYMRTRPVFSNLLQVLYELPHDMSAWIIGEISRTENLIRGAKAELVENGPVRATVKVTHRFRDSEIVQYISLCRGIPRLDFKTFVDWKEVSDEKTEAPMLKVSFTPILGYSKATFEVPFGYIERPADGTEVPALRWVDVSDEEYGFSLLNDSKYGFDVKGNTVRMTLVRTSYNPDPRPDQKVHEIKYSVYPHRNGWKEALTFRKGYEVNHPLKAFVIADRLVSKECAPEETSFLQVKPDNVVVSCIKLAEDSEDCIVRIYDATGSGAEAELTFWFNVREAEEVDLTEKKVRTLELHANKVRLKISPFEIRTIRVKQA
jgi:alpha-mannosidase